MKHTIASFKRLRIAFLAFFILLLIILLYSTTLHIKHDFSIVSVLYRAQIWLPIVWASIILLTLLESFLVWQIIFDNSRAVWVEDGALIYLNRCFLRVPLAKIVAISMGTFGRYNQPGIIIIHEGGGRRVIPVANFSERGDIILNRLHESVNQYRTPSSNSRQSLSTGCTNR
jgi:hypothetical protein